jgi:hypothetical protein
MKALTPEGRKALRAVVQAIVLVGFLALVWRLAGAGDVHWLIAVIAIAVTGNQIENGVKSFKIGAGGIEADGNGEDKP